MPSARLSRRLIYRLSASRRLARSLRRFPIAEQPAWHAAERYLGGRRQSDAIATLERLHADGFATSIDYFGEAETDPAVVETTVEEYVRLGAALEALEPPVNVWVDLSNVGLDISVGFCRVQLERIVGALPAGSRLQVRAHDSARTDRILDLVTELGAQGASVMPTLQANLRRSPGDAARLAETGLPVLLVKGAHGEPPELAHRWGEDTDLAFIALAHQLHAAGAELAIGTHDPVIREALLASFEAVRVEMLLGVRHADARALLERGHSVRLYVPYGRDWLRYWIRRVSEDRGA